MKNVELALFVIEKTRDIGWMDGSVLSRCQGWDRVKAHRYLVKLADLGWLERTTSKGRPLYVLGPKALRLTIDLQRIA